MKGPYILILVTLLCNVLSSQLDKLELVVAVFRHGDRTKDASTSYPKDPYNNITYHPYGLGQLTEAGKLRSYRLGKQLRRRYSDYLTLNYTADQVSVASTNYNRTKETLKFVINGLFDTDGVNVRTGNIPMKYTSPFYFCRRYREMYDQYENFGEGQKLKNKYTSNFHYVSRHTGINVTNLMDLTLIHACLESEEEWKLKLPKWSSLVYKNYLESASRDFFTLSVALPEFNRLFGGVLLKRILSNMDMKIDGSPNYRLHLYSGHDINIVGLLGAMDIFWPHMIPYSACVLMELHKIKDIHYVKILYQENTPRGFKEMALPGCNVLCPIESFRKIVARNIPDENDNCHVM